MKIFMSHSYVERTLAEAWKQLLENLPKNDIEVYYSSDPRPTGGLGLGRWRRKIYEEIEASDAILVIVTQDSNERPWLAFESGVAQAGSKTVTPIVYFMEVEKIHHVYQGFQAFRGDDPETIHALCRKLVSELGGNDLPEDKYWEVHVSEYMEAVEGVAEESYTRAYFIDNFHDVRNATAMEGTWHAKWTKRDDAGEEVFEFDRLWVWTTENRIRMVGDGAKGKDYPMEGVVSGRGTVAMSYFSVGDTTICGTLLLEPSGAGMDPLEGTWQGFTAKTLREKPVFTEGRVVMSMDEAVAREYWGLLPPEQAENP